MSAFLERIALGKVLISDGGTGTYLQARGLEVGGCPEKMTSTHPDLIRQMACDYFAAGADMVETNTFGANKYLLGKYDMADEVESFNRQAAELAKSAAPEGCFVLGSIGPSGELPQFGDPDSEAQLVEAFALQASGLAAGGVDAICVETMSDHTEMAAAVRAAREATDLPVIASMTFDQGPRGYFTMMGSTPQAAVEQMTQAGADVIGANCGVGIAQMIEIISAMRSATDKPILTHVNAGIPRMEGQTVVYPHDPEFMAQRIGKVVDAGANIVGGCCGTGPEHIRQIAKVLKA